MPLLAVLYRWGTMSQACAVPCSLSSFLRLQRVWCAVQGLDCGFVTCVEPHPSVQDLIEGHPAGSGAGCRHVCVSLVCHSREYTLLYTDSHVL